MAELGLSDPLPVQYLRWLRDIVRGNLGHSFFRAESVADMILRRGPLTAEIALISVVLSWIVGIPVAILSALKPNSSADGVLALRQHPVHRHARLLARHADRAGAAVLVRLPGAARQRPLLRGPVGNLQIVIGPAIVLGLGQAAYIARMARSSLLEVIREDYVRTARAKGLNGRLVIALHALPNALLPVITLSGVLLGFVLAGSIPVERAFGVPGLGYAMVTAVSERDIFVMQNLVFLYAVVFVLLNILVDLTIAWLDPRIRLLMTSRPSTRPAAGRRRRRASRCGDRARARALCPPLAAVGLLGRVAAADHRHGARRAADGALRSAQGRLPRA